MQGQAQGGKRQRSDVKTQRGAQGARIGGSQGPSCYVAGQALTNVLWAERQVVLRNRRYVRRRTVATLSLSLLLVLGI